MRRRRKHVGKSEAKRATAESSAELLRALVAHLRRNRVQLRKEWARRIREAKLLTAMSKEEIFSEATTVYDNYVKVLETGSVEALRAYARNLSERVIPRGVETHEVVGLVLLLRDVLARSLFKKYQGDFELLNCVLDAYEPAANRIANTVAVSFVEERERVIRQQHLMQENLRSFSNQVLHVLEEERRRISRELHDEIGQSLTAINMNLAMLQRTDELDAKVREHTLADTQALAQQTMDAVHRFAGELRPAMLDELGLIPALRSYLKGFAERTGLRVRFSGSAGAEKLNDEQKTVVFRVAQESLTNVGKHAHASRVDVRLRPLKTSVQMQITDNGRAFKVDQQHPARARKRLGLLGMQERVRLVNGRFAVTSAPGKGTTVRVEIPVEDSDRGLKRYARDHCDTG